MSAIRQTPCVRNASPLNLSGVRQAEKGVLKSWAVFHRAYWPAFEGDLPYTVCLVRLEEGPLFITNFAKGMKSEPVVGASVRVVFEPVTDEITLPQFSLD